MTLCLDIHTHHPAPQPFGIVALAANEAASDFHSVGDQRYSVGVHPWLTAQPIADEIWGELEKLCALPEVVAIGECGIDKLKGGPLFRQINVFKRHIDLSEKLGKPLVIHDVKAHDVIVGLKNDLKPTQNWVIHGFRAKPSVAKMMTDAGIYLSFGEKFNPETPKAVPFNFILAETDESDWSIQEVIANLSLNLGRDITETIAVNTAEFLQKKL